jgi:ketosteroid isomerase-like protein
MRNASRRKQNERQNEPVLQKLVGDVDVVVVVAMDVVVAGESVVVVVVVVARDMAMKTSMR